MNKLIMSSSWVLTLFKYLCRCRVYTDIYLPLFKCRGSHAPLHCSRGGGIRVCDAVFRAEQGDPGTLSKAAFCSSFPSKGTLLLSAFVVGQKGYEHFARSRGLQIVEFCLFPELLMGRILSFPELLMGTFGSPRKFSLGDHPHFGTLCPCSAIGNCHDCHRKLI